MVANKLLVRAYLDSGAPERARERLDLYNLLNDSDPEIEVLNRRIVAMNRPAAPKPPEPTSKELASPVPAPPFSDLLATAPRDTPLDGTDLFGLAPLQAAPETPLVQRPESVPTSLAPELPPTRTAGPFDEVFPGLHLERAHDRYLVGLSAEGIFPLPQPGARPGSAPFAGTEPAFLPQETAQPVLSVAPPAPTTPRGQDPFDLGPVQRPRLSFEPELLAAPVSASEREQPVEPFLLAEPLLPAEPFLTAAPPLLTRESAWAAAQTEPGQPAAYLPPEPLPLEEEEVLPSYDLEAEAFAEEETINELHPFAALETAPSAPLETVTLADLYVGQGYPIEAERIYREILEREPDNQAARTGLDRLARMERRYRPLEARDLLFDFQETPADGDSDAPRLRHLLQSYLQRLRERSPRDVS